MTTTTQNSTSDDASEDQCEDAGELTDLSIAPGAGEPEAVLGKDLSWSVAADGPTETVAVEWRARDGEADVYTALAKGRLSEEQARDLRDALDEVLAS